MPQHHLATGTVSYPDAKSNYPAFPQVGLGKAIVIGIGAGAVGALFMTGSNWLEMLITKRPPSYVPARTIGNHLGVTPSYYSKHTDLLNNAHHYGMGMLAGPVRAVMSYYGVIGPFAVFVHTGVRILLDQVAETSNLSHHCRKFRAVMLQFSIWRCAIAADETGLARVLNKPVDNGVRMTAIELFGQMGKWALSGICSASIVKRRYTIAGDEVFVDIRAMMLRQLDLWSFWVVFV
ncbi:hypothetical protein E8E12_003409 [Didymella heteroderae]|uniref:Uncharacterized protein n=1 Tax=Didymella heteroderae TaxID=1769908 RepID=A0A9P4WX60_9PLEO|nr:hypothetical protein E8E12_003409 [Didymella heteroderae]